MSINNFPATLDTSFQSFIITDTQVQIDVLGDSYSQGSPGVGVINPIKALFSNNQEIPREFVFASPVIIQDWNRLNNEQGEVYQGKAFQNGIQTLFDTWKNLWVNNFQCPFVIVYDYKVDFLYTTNTSTPNITRPDPKSYCFLVWTFKILPFTIDPSLI
jgi:hypothetical protein